MTVLSLSITQGGILWGKSSRTSSREKPSHLKLYPEVFKTAQKKKRENCWRRTGKTWGHLRNVGGMTGLSKMLDPRILEGQNTVHVSYLSASADCYFFKASGAWPPDRRMFTIFFFLFFLLFNGTVEGVYREGGQLQEPDKRICNMGGDGRKRGYCPPNHAPIYMPFPPFAGSCSWQTLGTQTPLWLLQSAVCFFSWYICHERVLWRLIKGCY